MGAFLVISTILAVLPGSLSLPQHRTNTNNNQLISNVDEINALNIENQASTAVELASISSTMRLVVDKLDLLISKQITNTNKQQLLQPEKSLPFRPTSSPFNASRSHNAAVVEIPARKREKSGAVRFPDVNEFTTSPSAINAVLERPHMETATQPMVKVRDTTLAGSGTFGIISGRY